MKKTMLFILSLLVAGSSLASPAIDDDGPKSTWETIKSCGNVVIPACLKSSAIAITSSLGHELGHIVAAKSLLNWSCDRFYIDLQGLPLSTHAGVGFAGTDEIDLVGSRVALMLAAGPLAGIGTVIGILKMYNIINEYKKSHSIKEAIWQGLRKPIFNAEQGMIIQSIAAFNIWGDANNLLPFSATNDCDYFIKALGFASPLECYPALTQNVTSILSLLGGAYLGLQIYNVNTGSHVGIKDIGHKIVEGIRLIDREFHD